MKRYVWLVAILSAVIILSLATACSGGGEKETATPTATLTVLQLAPTPTPKEAVAQPAATWADIPVYAGAKSVQEWNMSLPGVAPGQEYDPLVSRYYTTKDAVDKVADFYKAEMPKKGWKETLWMTAEGVAWGAYTSKDGNVGVGFFAVKDDSQNVTGIMIWRGEKKK